MRNYNFAVFMLSIVLLGVIMPVSAQDRSIMVTIERNLDKGYDFNYTKTAEGSFLVVVHLNNPVNCNETEFKEVVTSASGLLYRLDPSIKNSPVSFTSFSTSYLRGIPNPKTDSTFIYALPYKKGNAFTVSYLTDLKRYYFGNLSTKHFKAYEFSSKDCDTVCAIRKGYVVSIVDKYDMDTTIAKSFTSNVNSVIIEQPDGTLASYTGFKKGSIFVKEGESVLPYKPLGLLSHYDSYKNYSLRLTVYFLSDTKVDFNNDRPVTYKNSKSYYDYIDPWFVTDKGVTKLKNHTSYRSDLSMYVLEREMSKKELKGIGKTSKETNQPVRIKAKVEKSLLTLEKDTLYFDANGNEVSGTATASEYQITWVDKNNEHIFHGQSYYISGKLKSESIYSDIPDTFPVPRASYYMIDKRTGVKWLHHGDFKQWYENGQLQREITFRNGTISGKLITYWDNGKVKRTNVDKNGNKIKGQCFDRDGKEIPYYPYAKAAVFADKTMTVEQYVASKAIYPVEAQEKSKEGIVQVQFKILKDGSVGNITNIRSSDSIFEKELRRVIRTIPKYEPARLDGENSPYSISLTHRFTLPDMKTDWNLKLNTQDTTFYNEKGKIVPGRKYAGYYEILTPDPLSTDKVIEHIYYISNKKKSEKYFMKTRLSEEFPDSLSRKYGKLLLSTAYINSIIRAPEGKYAEWYENGQLSKEIHYQSGIKDGPVHFFWEDGTPRREDVYHHGVLVSGKCYDFKGRPVDYFDMDMKASFQGGKQAMIDFLSTHLKYPERALKNKKQGTVEVKFVVDINGNVSSLMIPKGIDKELDVEAMRLVRSMPKWLPELKDGSLVPSYQSLKIEFDI